MVARVEKQVDGKVSAYDVRRAVSRNWAHEYTIGGVVYTHFSSNEVALMRVGDTVGFLAEVRRLKTGSKANYFSIVELSIKIHSTLAPHGSDHGYVYVLTHPAMKGLRKIGFTRGSPQSRADAISASTGVPGKFKVEWAFAVSGDPHGIERAVHSKLASTRQEKEFFKVSAAAAREAVQLAYAELYPEASAQIDQALTARAKENEIARKEALARIKEQQERLDQEKQRSRPEYRWLSEGALIVRVLAEFTGPALAPLPKGFWGSIFGIETKYHERVELKIVGKKIASGAQAWEVAAEGWIENALLSKSAVAASLEQAIDTLAAMLGGRMPVHLNASIQLPACWLSGPPEPPPGRLSRDLTLSIGPLEASRFRLSQEDGLHAACLRLRGIARRAQLPKQDMQSVSGSRKTKANDAKGRPPYPWGCKARARVMFKQSGMADREIDVYLEQFADPDPS